MDNEDQCFYPYQLFLLMSSNFAGLLTTIIAIRKRYFAESAIYFCTMIISMVYHGCDCDERIAFCVFPFFTLKFADFYSALFSMWLTALLVAQVTLEQVKSFAQLFGAYSLALLLRISTEQVWVMILPVVACIGVVAKQWFSHYATYGTLPSHIKRRNFIAACCLSLLGLGLHMSQLILENKYYSYTHSTWHVLIGIAMTLFIPKKSLPENILLYDEMRDRDKEYFIA